MSSNVSYYVNWSSTRDYLGIFTFACIAFYSSRAQLHCFVNNSPANWTLLRSTVGQSSPAWQAEVSMTALLFMGHEDAGGILLSKTDDTLVIFYSRIVV